MDPDSGCFLPIAIVEFLSTEFGGSVSWRGNVLVLGLRGGYKRYNCTTVQGTRTTVLQMRQIVRRMTKTKDTRDVK